VDSAYFSGTWYNYFIIMFQIGFSDIATGYSSIAGLAMVSAMEMDY